jgi:CubicO group peptidase (beta-lactamase class C family)
MIRPPLASFLFLMAAPAPAVAQERADPFPAATPASQGIRAEALAGLVEAVNGYIERDRAVGAELLVIKNRRTVLHESFGYVDRDEDERWVNGTVCNIRSMTKPLTGAAVQILVDRGKLSLDDPAAKYLPGFDTDEAREITVRQIITHRAGLPLTIMKAIDDYPSLVDLGNAVGARGPEFEPDSRFWYTDSGTDALGAIVEVASGKKLDEFVHEALFVPLGMDDSFYFIDDDDPRRSRIASLYIGGAKRWKRFLDPDDGAFYPFAWGSQSVYSTTTDYAKFLAMLLDGGRAGDRRVLSEAAVARVTTPVSEMTTMGSEVRFPTSFSALEAYAASPDVPAEFSPYLGTYIADWANHMKEEFVVKFRNGKLALDVPSQMLFELAPANGDDVAKWTFAISPQISVWFDRDEAGTVDCLRIRQGPLTFEAPRKGSPHAREVAEANRPDPDLVAKISGRYRDPESDAEVEVLVDGDYVAIRREGDVFHLWKVPIAEIWQVRENPMVSITFEESDGVVTSFTRHSPGGEKLVLQRVK